MVDDHALGLEHFVKVGEPKCGFKAAQWRMAAQTDLVAVLGQFDPKLVKMCPAGDRAED